MSSATIDQLSESLKPFFDNLDAFVEVDGGIAKLREFILRLAVRGKLVAQNPSDEPAALALSRIRDAKANGNRKEKKCRNQSKEESQALDWQVPSDWAVTPLSDLVTVLNGRAYKKEELLDKGTPVLRVGNLFTSKDWYYSDLELEPDKYCDEGDLIFAWSASFGPFIWDGPKVIYHYHIWKLDFHSEEDLCKEYLYQFLLYKTKAIKQAGHGVSMVHMTKQKMERLLVPLPPLSEQRRIVAKVDGLMALCDELEAQNAQRVSVRERASRSSLATLVNSRSRADLTSAWKRLSDHFEVLYDTPETLADLRQTILQLAVQGKLVPQDPNEEPASIAIGRIRRRTAKLIETGALKTPKTVLPLDEENERNLPPSWTWIQLCDILRYGPRNGYSPKPVDFETPVKSLTLSATTSGTFDGRHSKFIDEEIDNDSYLWLRDGDFLIQRSNSLEYVGVSAIYAGGPNEFIYPDLMMKFRIDTEVDQSYLLLVLKSQETRRYFQNQATGTSGSMRKINQSIVVSAPIPLPPLAEQKRIVAKVDQLLSQCDELSARLQDRQTTTQQLLTALIHSILDKREN